MSMLTPLGSGGAGYRRRRRWPRVLAVVLVLALVTGAGAAAWWWFTQREDASSTAPASPTRTCTTPTPKPPKKLPAPPDVTVAVLNGTERAGLALDTADALADRGFDVTDIGNTDRPVDEGVALVRYQRRDLAAAVQVASHLPGAELRPVAKVSDAQVAVWLGPEVGDVATRSQADPAAAALPPGEPQCTKVK